MPFLSSLILCGEQPDRNCSCSCGSPTELIPIEIPSSIEDERPEQESGYKLDEKEQPMRPRYQVAVIRKKNKLERQDDIDWSERQRDPGHRLEEPAQPTLAFARRTRENLCEKGVGQSLPHQRVFSRRFDGLVD